MRYHLLLLLFAVIVAATGCGNPEEKLVGTWQGSCTIQRPPTGNDALDRDLAKLNTKVNYTLELRKDRTYIETVAKDNIEGTWRFANGTLNLDPKTVDGEDPAKKRRDSEDMMSKLHIRLPLTEGTDGPRMATVSEDFKTITMPSIGTTADLKKVGK